MLLIDLQMPESCDVCPFNYDFCWCRAFGDHDKWEKYSDDWNNQVCEGEHRPEYCPLKEIVRCKDCKHRPKEIPFTTTWGRRDTYLEFPEGSRCPCQCSDDPYYSWNPGDEWFCADGEAKGE